MKKMITVAGIVSVLMLSSCVTLNKFPIEVFQPAKIELPVGIKNITLVNRNLKYSNDTLQKYYAKDYKLFKDISKVNIDSLCIQTCLDSLSSNMMTPKRFNKISILPVSSLPVHHVKSITPPSKGLIQKISSENNADAVIFLDMYSSFYSIYPYSESNRSIAKVITASMWTIYDAANAHIINHMSVVDTLYWDGLDEQQNYNASKIPNKKAASQIAAGLTGVKYSKNIVPNWVKVYRTTLSCNQIDFKTAAELVKKNKWEVASELWKKYIESTNKRYQIQAMYNLAVASEMNGDIDGAITMISNASKISSSSFYNTENKLIRNYSAVLTKRKTELSKINSLNYEL